jgi:hypothetical protein
LSNGACGREIRRYAWDIAVAVLLLIAAYALLTSSAHHTRGGYGYGYRMYEEGAYFERLRIVVCAAWVGAAIRFYVFRLFPITLLSLIIAWLFNPIVPVTMRRYQWQPYDHWTMILSFVAAVTLVAISYRSRRASVSATPELRDLK